MLRLLFLLMAILTTLPSLAQDLDPATQEAIVKKLLPPGMTKAEYVGDVLAVIAFCGLTNSADQYETAQFIKLIGITDADRSAMEAGRDKHYAEYRREITTAPKHVDFCRKLGSHPIISRIMRRGVPSFPGSDERRQEEKIHTFGDALGAMAFCKITVDGNKWGTFLVSMGVKSDSMDALTKRANEKRKTLMFESSTPQQAAELCAQVRTNPTVVRFMER